MRFDAVEKLLKLEKAAAVHIGRKIRPAATSTAEVQDVATILMPPVAVGLTSTPPPHTGPPHAGPPGAFPAAAVHTVWCHDCAHSAGSRPVSSATKAEPGRTVVRQVLARVIQGYADKVEREFHASLRMSDSASPHRTAGAITVSTPTRQPVAADALCISDSCSPSAPLGSVDVAEVRAQPIGEVTQ